MTPVGTKKGEREPVPPAVPEYCLDCVHYLGVRRIEPNPGRTKHVCFAYRTGIPERIIVGVQSHNFPYKQVNAVVFKPVTSTEEG